jgi:protoporphyrinogen oxidase
LIIDEKWPAGSCNNTEMTEGFSFDKSGHVIHCNSTYYEDFVRATLNTNMLQLERKAYFAFQENLFPFPFQVYFNRIGDTNIINECIQGLKKIRDSSSNKSPENFKEWIVAHFGEGISKNFMLPYNGKMWCYPLENMAVEWVEKYAPKPNVNEILEQAEKPNSEEKKYGYNSSFLYPKFGGIAAFVIAIAAKIGGNFFSSFIKSRLFQIDIDKKLAVLSDGTKIHWSSLFSTIPLPELIRLHHVPNAIKAYSECLKFTSLLTVNFGIRGKINTDAHWIYFPEGGVPFHRVVVQSNLSPYTAPDSASSIIVEKSLKPGEIWNQDEVINQTIIHLYINKLIQSKSDVLVSKVNFIKYAYPICDTMFCNGKNAVLTFLANHCIYSMGRFGSWEYLSMEDCFMQGKDITNHMDEKK